jgi:hypothetical protein
LQRAAELYRQIKADDGEEWQRLQYKGQIGSEAHRAGGTSFGGGSRTSAHASVAPLLQAMQQGTRAAFHTSALDVVRPEMHTKAIK